MDINVHDLDWKSILIKKYRNYDLTEEDCMVLFVTDCVLNIQPKTLITKEVLSPYMVENDKIDASLSSLMAKKIMVIKNEGNSFFTSIEDFKTKLFDDAIKDLTLRNQNRYSSVSDGIYQEAETIANRSLTPLERDQITSWLKSGADEGMVREALQKSITKSGNISFKTADKLILQLQRSQSRKDLGASTVNEETKKREEIKDLLDNFDWTYHG